jgi:ABC-2 type transport system permease protein
VADLVVQTGERIESARHYLFPPLIGYGKVKPRPEDEGNAGPSLAGQAGANPVAGIFWFILPGMAAMFLLFIADNAVRDLYREQRFQTLQRFRTLRHGLVIFVGAKVAFAMVILLISSLILFGGGAMVFRFHWSSPVALAVLTVAYALFAAGFMALIASLAGTEKRADTLNTIIAMGMGLVGGCMFPRDQLPAFIGSQVTPLMPTFWFADAARALQTGMAGHSWVDATLMLTAVGLTFIGLAAWIFRQRLERGARS